MQTLCAPLGWLMKVGYDLLHNYGLAIIFFTLLTKVILFPMSLWVHRNGVRMVRIEPVVNRLKIRYFGDQDRIADETAELYKKEHYSPFATVIPVAVQLLLLLGLIQVIYHPLTYVLRLPAGTTEALISQAAKLARIDPGAGAAEMLAVNAIQKAADPAAYLAVPGMTGETLSAILGLNMSFLGVDLSAVPAQEGGILLLMPLLAGLAALALSLSQNRLNPLQASQGKTSQLLSMAFSVGLSLTLGFIVPAGVGFYWIWSNLFSILQQPVLNRVYPPEKQIDYAELEASRKELAEYTGSGQKDTRSREEKRREQEDYKRFFAIGNKHLVFYSESSGFYKYFESAIRYILDHSRVTVHYVTSDPNDQIFDLSRREEKIEAYYIGEKKLITLFMKLEADAVVMTMSDLDNYHYKRSYYRKDINYIYMFHYPLSTHMVLHTGALRHYDTILCVGEFQFEEIRQTEALFGDPEQRLIACGYGQLEKLYDAYQRMEKPRRARPKILVAPSWQQDNILDSCVDELLGELLGQGFQVVIRPHPEYMKRYRVRMEDLMRRYAGKDPEELAFELDFTSNQSIFDSDLVISDWSGTAYEAVLVTEKPCVFVDTPPKINNPDYEKITVPPLEISLRDQVGIRVQPGRLAGLAGRIRSLLGDSGYAERIRAIRESCIANFGRSGEVAGEAILGIVREQIEKRKKG